MKSMRHLGGARPAGTAGGISRPLYLSTKQNSSFVSDTMLSLNSSFVSDTMLLLLGLGSADAAA
jgi:hypothetical protein